MSNSNFTLIHDNNPLGSPRLDFNFSMQQFDYNHHNFSLTANGQDPQYYEAYHTSESHETAEPRNCDTLSNSSNYDSSKYSPEYQYSTEYDEKSSKNSKIPPIIRKGIHKYYEPIADSGVTYKYEEDPSEYKKARKRIQNRESATRVRNRKKTYTEELEAELALVRKECQDLRLKNGALMSENSVLKQQVTFYDKVVNKVDEPSTTSPSLDQDCDDYLVPIDNIKEEDVIYDNELSPKLDFGYPRRDGYRSNFFSHLTILGVMSVLIVCSLIPADYLPAERATFNGIGVKSPIPAPNVNKWGLHSVLDSIFKSTNHSETLKTGAQIVFGGAYAIYFIYVAILIIKEKVKRN